MLDNRLCAANALLEDHPCKELDEVYNYFETVGIYLKVNALDTEMTWATFEHWAVHYWYAGQTYIRHEREEDHTIWEYYEYLVTTLIKFGAKYNPTVERPPNSDQIKRFLLDERDLLQAKSA